MKLMIGLLYTIAILLMTAYFNLGVEGSIFLLIAGGLGAYMAMNIGANDVANSVGPAVGSKSITLVSAIFLAAIGNFLGAMIAGGEVVKTIKKGIIDISGFSDPNLFIYAMMAALLSAALWLNIATYLRAPVSTTHAITGGVMGAGIAALGFSVVNWGTMGKIAASWIISPLFGGIIAAGLLLSIKHNILFKKDKKAMAEKWVPMYIAIMSWSFSTYIILKGLKNLIKIDFLQASLSGLIIAIVVYFATSKIIKHNAHKLKNDRKSINKLFTIPLIFSVFLLTFAHGANDVANAIGPMAAIYDAVLNGDISTKVTIPLWIMFIGATGIAVGLALYGPRIIKTVGSEITEIDQVRAFAIALSASITVIIASQLGLPVSSTHIALGGIFGIGLLREWLDKKHHNKKEIYVKRDIIYKIISAWLITVPAVAILSGCIYMGLATMV